MAGSRTLAALVGIALSIAVSFVLYRFTGWPLFFLFVPFVPFLFGSNGSDSAEQPPVRACPSCEFRTLDAEYEFCPRDGSRLRES